MDADLHEQDGTILLVDDDEMVRELLSQCLRAAGYRVLEAHSGTDALKKFEKHSSEIRLLLTDIVMPGLFGDQLAMRLTELKPELKVVMMSGNSPESLETEIPLCEGKNFLRKPFQIDDLRACVSSRLHDSVR